MLTHRLTLALSTVKMFVLALTQAFTEENFTWTPFHWPQWLSQDILATKRLVCTTKRPITQFGESNHQAVWDKTALARLLTAKTTLFLNMLPLLITCTVITPNIKTNSALNWKFPAWLLPRNTRRKSFWTNHKAPKLERMCTNKLHVKICGNSATLRTHPRPKTALLDPRSLLVRFCLWLSSTCTKLQLWVSPAWSTASPGEMIWSALTN